MILFFNLFSTNGGPRTFNCRVVETGFFSSFGPFFCSFFSLGLFGISFNLFSSYIYGRFGDSWVLIARSSLFLPLPLVLLLPLFCFSLSFWFLPLVLSNPPELLHTQKLRLFVFFSDTRHVTVLVFFSSSFVPSLGRLAMVHPFFFLLRFPCSSPFFVPHQGTAMFRMSNVLMTPCPP